MGVLVGAYPLLDGRSASQQSELYAKLSEVPHVSGLELPWSGSIHPLGEQWLASLMPDRWNVVITTIPGTVSALNTDPAFGLASLSKDGSEAAVAELVRVRDGARRLNDAAGARVVSGVELHSAPARGRASGRPRRDPVRCTVERGDWR